MKTTGWKQILLMSCIFGVTVGAVQVAAIVTHSLAAVIVVGLVGLAMTFFASMRVPELPDEDCQ